MTISQPGDVRPYEAERTLCVVIDRVRISSVICEVLVLLDLMELAGTIPKGMSSATEWEGVWYCSQSHHLS